MKKSLHFSSDFQPTTRNFKTAGKLILITKKPYLGSCVCHHLTAAILKHRLYHCSEPNLCSNQNFKHSCFSFCLKSVSSQISVLTWYPPLLS